MTIANQNAAIYRGDSQTLLVTLVDAAGAPFVLPAGGTIKWRLSLSAHDDEIDAIVRKELNAGIQVIDGVVEIDLTPGETNLAAGMLYYHELKVISGLDVFTAMTGTVSIKRALTMTGVVEGDGMLHGEVGVSANAVVV